MAGFEKLNKEINERINTISEKFEDNTITEKERNEIAGLIYPKLKFHIWKFCKTKEDTEEALQWTLKKIFNNVSKFDYRKAKFTTWIYTIARNETLYYLHIKKKISMGSIDSEGAYESTGSSGFEAFDTFEEDFKNLYDLTMSEIYGMEDDLLKRIAIDKMIKKDKVKSIADRYSINENTVKTKLRKIRSDIKTKVLENNPDIIEKLNHIFDI
jgi:DNA-directed RNA polymerase specialized sigma24 family protein